LLNYRKNITRYGVYSIRWTCNAFLKPKTF